MHNFYVPTLGQMVTKAKKTRAEQGEQGHDGDEANKNAQLSTLDQLEKAERRSKAKRYRVFGMTARILGKKERHLPFPHLPNI